MLVTNQRLDKLAASRNDFKSRGRLNGTCLSETLRALKRIWSNREPDAIQLGQANENSIVLLPNLDITIQGDNEEGEVIDSPTLVQVHVRLAKTHQCKRAQTVPNVETCISVGSYGLILRILTIGLHGTTRTIIHYDLHHHAYHFPRNAP
ncbi:hypothetical protein DFJ58DRAFT_736628 [Suillus subalutaceus]|uniref:uncharacterized protein n=1 Tax=Suillus subalutaceus TaxID=48586 RepID=UPI001B86CDFD|nr:uncharacterized protein DFJ58DRAFT_736628 [Suillus subalutaceus]KAG1831444.1 hypothetical protein DFJ58DRAFT_736628 [Suillus subalutaceus]